MRTGFRALAGAVLLAAGLSAALAAGPRPAPSGLEIEDLQGSRHRLADHRGKVVMLNFWGTWCPPCVEELPALGRLATELEGRPFVMLGVTVKEEPAVLKHFLERVPVAFPTLLDPEGQEFRRWRIQVFPTSFLIGPDGRVHEEMVGPRDWDDPHFRGFIEALMPDRPAPAATR
jgi:thiol-disulfide isomerase/thioredoxin